MNNTKINQAKDYFRPLCFGNEVAVAEKTFFHLLREDSSDPKALAEACGFEIPETHTLVYGRGSWQLWKK